MSPGKCHLQDGHETRLHKRTFSQLLHVVAACMTAADTSHEDTLLVTTCSWQMCKHSPCMTGALPCLIAVHHDHSHATLLWPVLMRVRSTVTVRTCLCLQLLVAECLHSWLQAIDANNLSNIPAQAHQRHTTRRFGM